MLESLRSINDTSLSDWQGVIGEELDEQRELAKEQAEMLKAVSDRLSAIEGANTATVPFVAASTEIDEIKKQIRALAADMSGGAFRSKQRPNFQQIETACPVCKVSLSYKQRAKDGDRKAIQCKGCATNLISAFNGESGFSLKVRENLPEPISCPTCSADQIVYVDEWPSASTTLVCESCSAALRVSRADGGETLKITAVNPARSTETLTPELIEAVRQALPAQPWPKGIHQVIAESLTIKATVVQKAMQHLIRTGVFMDQLNGVVCSTAEKLAILRASGSDL